MIGQKEIKVFVANMILHLEFPKEVTKQQLQFLKKSSDTVGTASCRANCNPTELQNNTVNIHRQRI